jgi:phosphoglycerate dehydrogenase-like enzyme
LVDRRPPLVLVAPGHPEFLLDAVRQGGGALVANGAATGDKPVDGLVWTSLSPAGLLETVREHPNLRWVQLPTAGVDGAVKAGIFEDVQPDGLVWTCAKGSYARPVAEHALCLALAGLRHLPQRARARSWGARAGISLYDAPVTVLGGGGITTELLALLAPFHVQATVVRRTGSPVAGAVRSVTTAELRSVLPGALVVFVALALSPETVHIVSDQELDLMGESTWLVNVARGRHVDTDALVRALRERRIGGAALDVTDPEPLPDGHPLWSLPNCIVTPHTADTEEMTQPLLAARIRDNVERFASGLPLVGIVDTAAGY